MNRRGFLAGILAASAAPAIVRASSLMKIIPRERLVWVDEWWLTGDPNATFQEIVSTAFRRHGKKFRDNLMRDSIYHCYSLPWTSEYKPLLIELPE